MHRIEITMTIMIGSVLGPDIELGAVYLDTLPNKTDTTCALLDLSSSSWFRMCRKLQPQPKDNELVPVVEFDVISWPPEHSRPPRASAHPHKVDLDLLSSCGMRLLELPKESRELMKVCSGGTESMSAVKGLDTKDNGVVDKQEFVAAGGTEDDFRQIDMNSDGVVDADELIAHEWSIKTEKDQYSGCLSPMCTLTLGPAVLERLGVPGTSSHFCFAYRDNKVQNQNSEMEPGVQQMMKRGVARSAISKRLRADRGK